MKKLILASASARRKELMEKLGYSFEIQPALKEEKVNSSLPLSQAIEQVALGKAKEVYQNNPECLVLGSDTIVTINNLVLGKPSDKADARRMLKMLSGNIHEVITGFAFLSSEESYVSHQITQVKFTKMTDDEIEEYISTCEPYDKAGGYAIQGLASKFIESIQGDVYTVIGLPVFRIYQYLKEFYRKDKL